MRRLGSGAAPPANPHRSLGSKDGPAGRGSSSASSCWASSWPPFWRGPTRRHPSTTRCSDGSPITERPRSPISRSRCWRRRGSPPFSSHASSWPCAGGLQAVPATRRVPGDVRGGGLARRGRALGAAAGAGRRTRRRARPVHFPVASDLGDRDHRDPDGVRARSARACPARPPGRGEPVDRRRGGGAAVPGDRRPQRDALFLAARRRRPAARVPVAGARRRVPRDVPQRGATQRTSTWGANAAPPS